MARGGIAVVCIAAVACGGDTATSSESSSSTESSATSGSSEPGSSTTVATSTESVDTSHATTMAETTDASSGSGTHATESSSSDTTSTSTGSGESTASSTETSTSQETTSSTGAGSGSSSESTSSTTGGPVCGNDILEDGETCDDGNLFGGDGCEDDCTSSDDMQPLWTLELGGPFGYADCGGGVAFDSEDNLVLAGIWEDQVWVAKYDSDYVQLWEVLYPSISGAGACHEVRVAVDAADNVGVIGHDPDYGVQVAVLDVDGDEQWTATFNGPAGGGNAGDIAFDLDGNVLVTGELFDVQNVYWVAKLSADGTTLWEDTYQGPGCCINGGRGIAADADGNVWAAGYVSAQMFQTDVFMRQYDPDGNELATEEILGVDAAAQDIAYDLVLDDLGDRIAVGTYRVDAGVDDNDAWVRRYQGAGEQWMTSFEGTATVEDLALGVALAPDGTIVVSGFMFNAPADGDRNRWLAKLSAEGAPIWQRRALDESSDEGWRGVAVASDGRIAVAGVASFAFPWIGDARFAVYPP